MAHQKTFSTFSEQIEWLQNKKRLLITDKQYAEETLREIGYFPLIGGYKHLFRIPLTKKYKDGTSFEEIVALYKWVLINVLTFGNLSKMYQVLPQSLQSKICKDWGTINRHQMEQFLSVLTKFRNVCAHGERLFTYHTMDNISDLPLHQKLSIPKNGIQYQYGKTISLLLLLLYAI